MTVLKRF